MLQQPTVDLRSLGHVVHQVELKVLADLLGVLAVALLTVAEIGAHGLMVAMGPGFCSEHVLLEW